MKKSTMLKYLEYASLCELKAKDYKVFLFIISDLIESNEIRNNQNTTAEHLGITKSDVSKALRRLEKNKILSFSWVSIRKKLITLVPYDDDELDELISEKIEENIDRAIDDDWED
ncbi:MarR family transcriptional regulator [Cohnella suwonensis]|uniref:MarR family transcriptional regulator n=1 Tax=Cohnella suwonensis TaxID=696072 RepID=A0ABW0M211_9BACL